MNKLELTFITLQASDIITTHVGLNYFNLSEQNQLALSIFQNYGFLTGILLKILATIIVLSLILIIKIHISEKLSIAYLLVIIAYMTYVVINNIHLIIT